MHALEEQQTCIEETGVSHTFSQMLSLLRKMWITGSMQLFCVFVFWCFHNEDISSVSAVSNEVDSQLVTALG